MENPNGFRIRTRDGHLIRFRYYEDDAPITSRAFHALLPFTRTYFHARTSGHEFWTDEAPTLNIIQENASVFCLPGEAGISPILPKRLRTAGMMGIYYGEGRGLDATNIFAKVIDDDFEILLELGNQIWKSGEQPLIFESL